MEKKNPKLEQNLPSPQQSNTAILPPIFQTLQ